jgi:hypothetical protein
VRPINLGVGLAPAVTIVGEWVYVAYGVQPDALIVVTLTLAGIEVRRDVITDGFFNSFPRFSGPWMAYKRNHDWRPAARHVQTGRFWMFRGQADGNFGVVVNADLNLVAYQWTSSYAIWLGSLLDGADAPTSMRGAPDGLGELVDSSHVTLRKDTRTSVPGILWPVRAGHLTVGEIPDLSHGAPPRGAAVQIEGDALRVALADQDTPTPSNATDGETYAIVTGGPQGVRLLLGSRADILALPLAAPIERVPGPVVFVPPAPDTPAPVPIPAPRVPPPADPVPPHHPSAAPEPFADHQELKSMDTKIVAIKGPGGKYGRADAPNTGPWGGLGAGWRGLVWDGDAPHNDNYRFELTQPDKRHKLVNVATRGLFGVDATSAHIAQQFYLKPDENDRGWAESPVVYDGNVSGVVFGVVEFDQDAALGRFVSCAFAVEVLP